MKHIIYGLFDPRFPDVIRYIGRSSSGLKRPRQHGAASKLAADPTHKGNWLRQMLRDGVVHGIRVLEKLDAMELLNEAEQRWIRHGQEQAWPLTNLMGGGDGSYTEQSAEFRQRKAEISRQIWATKKHSPETIAKLKALKTGKPRSEETKAKIRAACNRPEAIAKMRAAVRSYQENRSPDHGANISAALRGRKASAETRAKQSASHKGKKFTPEHCANIAAAKIGKPRPDMSAWSRSSDGRAHLARLQSMAIGRPRPDLAERNRQRAAKKM